MMIILYILMYFVIGFTYAKIRKANDINNTNNAHDYAMQGILWLPSVIIWTTAFTFTFIYQLYKSKL